MTETNWLPPGEGWVEHDGKALPNIEEGTMIDYMFRSEREEQKFTSIPCGFFPGMIGGWIHTGGIDDIVAYSVIEPEA